MWHKALHALLPLTACWFKLMAAIAWEKVVYDYRVLRPWVRLRICRRGPVRKHDVLLELEAYCSERGAGIEGTPPSSGPPPSKFASPPLRTMSPLCASTSSSPSLRTTRTGQW